MRAIYNLSDIRRVSNKNKCRYTFRKKHYLGFIKRSLDYIFVSNSLPEYIVSVAIFNVFSTDHSQFFVIFLLTLTFRKTKVFGSLIRR